MKTFIENNVLNLYVFAGDDISQVQKNAKEIAKLIESKVRFSFNGKIFECFYDGNIYEIPTGK